MVSSVDDLSELSEPSQINNSAKTQLKFDTFEMWVKRRIKGDGQIMKMKCLIAISPKSEIPKFNGYYRKWPTFRNMFEELVHARNILNLKNGLFSPNSC